MRSVVSATPKGTTIRLLERDLCIGAEDPALASKLRICYGASQSSRTNLVGEASIRGEGPWVIDVPNREKKTHHHPIDAVRSFNHELLHAVMLERPELFFVHAGVVSFKGQGIALPGLSRAGKSTLVLAMIEQGARLLSDELLVFDPSTSLLQAYPRALKIRDECVADFPSYRTHFVGHGEGRFLPFDALPDQVVSPPCPLRAIVTPTWDEAGDDTPQRTNRGRALLELTASALNFGTHRQASLDHLQQLTDTDHCFTLRWKNPHRAAAKMLDILG